MMTYRPPLIGIESMTGIVSLPNPLGATKPASYDDQWAAISFPAGVDSAVDVAFPVPHSAKSETTAYLTIHWAPSTADTAPASFTAQYHWDVTGGVAVPVASWESVTVDAIPGGLANACQVANLATLNHCAAPVGSCFRVRLTRNGASDAYAGAIRLLYCGVCVQIDSFGSCGVGNK